MHYNFDDNFDNNFDDDFSDVFADEFDEVFENDLKMNSPDVINIGPLSNIRARPKHEGLCKLARLLVDGGQTLAAINENELQENIPYQKHQ